MEYGYKGIDIEVQNDYYLFNEKGGKMQKTFYIVVLNELDIIAFFENKKEAIDFSLHYVKTIVSPYPTLTIYETKLVKKVDKNGKDITNQWKEINWSIK